MEIRHSSSTTMSLSHYNCSSSFVLVSYLHATTPAGRACYSSYHLHPHLYAETHKKRVPDKLRGLSNSYMASVREPSSFEEAISDRFYNVLICRYCKDRKQGQVRSSLISSCCLNSSPSTSTAKNTTFKVVSEDINSRKFSYSRASPSVRWPNMKFAETETHQTPPPHFTFSPNMSPELLDETDVGVDGEKIAGEVNVEGAYGEMDSGRNDVDIVVLDRPGKSKAKKMTKLALKRAKDWRKRVQILTDNILHLKPEEFVADVLDEKLVQMIPTDYCFVVKWVGKSSWQRALEVYEWLNLKHWYTPNARMLATILSVLGKANQETLAVEIFNRVESSVGDTVQVYNAMMGVYARNGRFSKVQELLDLMRKRGCEPDLISLNTLINARLKSGPLEPNLAINLLDEVRRSGTRPDAITYNTLISACSHESNLQEAIKVYSDMEANNCQPDLWTYNAMISVFGRCGLATKAEALLKELQLKGFLPDAVTYNSLLYAFSREGNVDKVEKICEEMVKKGFAKDEMTYNTIIHMHGRKGRYDLAFKLYKDMKISGRVPDSVTYTVLIDCLGKANKMEEAANLMSEMLDRGVSPTLRTFSALICGYGKAGNNIKAEEAFNLMLKSGTKPDHLAYSVMIDILLRSNLTRRAISLYRDMIVNGCVPDCVLYTSLVRALYTNGRKQDLEKVISDMEQLGGLNPLQISLVLVDTECYDDAANMLKLAACKGYNLESRSLLPILSSYSSSGRHVEALDLLSYLKDHAPISSQLVDQALVVVLCGANQLDKALFQYGKIRDFGLFDGSSMMYEALIKCCKDSELFADASQVYSDMRFHGIVPSQVIFHTMVGIYCTMGFPETAEQLLDEAEAKAIKFDGNDIYVDLIDAYGKVLRLQKAESVVGRLKGMSKVVDRKVWNTLIGAYATHGCYEHARAAFNTMMKDGPSPTVDTINLLLQALVVDERLNELYVVIQELQDMGFKISKSTILLTLEAFASARNIFEVKKIYYGMKAAGYLPTMHLYRVMIGLFARAKKLRDVESLVSEMEDAGFKPDIMVWNSLLKMYTDVEDYKKTVEVYQKILVAELKPDESTYETLILMYSRDRRPEEGLALMHEMIKMGLDPKLDTYKSLIAAFAKQMHIELAEELFKDLLSKGYKLDRSFYHIMIKMYRNCGSHDKAERQLDLMKASGVDPSAATMHLLLMSYGSSGQPKEAEKVLDNLKLTGLCVGTLPYSSVIDAYLKNGDYSSGIQKLGGMKNEGLEPDHRIWTCFLRAASLCQGLNEALILLKAVQESGFDLPIRLLTESSKSLVSEVDHLFEKLVPMEDDAAFNFVNALEDLLWAFELRATASWVFQLAVKRRIYRQGVFRVDEQDWGADFRKLSAGAALVALTLWLDHMQDASLEGVPESPKSVVLITGAAEYNMVSLNSTLKAYLWEMGSPFLPCKTRTGLLIAKAHSLRMWLKDSSFCFDLELKNTPSLPESNSMSLIEGCFIRSGLVPAYKDIMDRLGEVHPKKFARLALLSDEKRDKAIRADVEGSKAKSEKMSKRKDGNSRRVDMKRKFLRYQKRKHVKASSVSCLT